MTVPARQIDVSTLPAEVSVRTQSCQPAFLASLASVLRLIHCDTVVGKYSGRRFRYLQLLVPPAFAFVPRGDQVGPARADIAQALARRRDWRPPRRGLGLSRFTRDPLSWRNCNPHYPLPNLETNPAR